jgi:hypothetical protein
VDVQFAGFEVTPMYFLSGARALRQLLPPLHQLPQGQDANRPGVNPIKLFFFVTDDKVKYARAFASGKPFQPGLIFADKARSLQESSGAFKSLQETPATL